MLEREEVQAKYNRTTLASWKARAANRAITLEKMCKLLSENRYRQLEERQTWADPGDTLPFEFVLVHDGAIKHAEVWSHNLDSAKGLLRKRFKNATHIQYISELTKAEVVRLINDEILQ